jgi:hypothetical protein
VKWPPRRGPLGEGEAPAPRRSRLDGALGDILVGKGAIKSRTAVTTYGSGGTSCSPRCTVRHSHREGDGDGQPRQRRDTPRTFEIHATTASLLANLERVRSEGKTTDPAVYVALHEKLTQALKKHEAGRHAVEANVLAGVVDQLLVQRGKAIEAAMADLPIASARDIIATGN